MDKENKNPSKSEGALRSIRAKKNIVWSSLLKAISIFISLQIVPLTLDFVSPEIYGIWLTMSSIIAWAAYFDAGFAHGFRNRFAEAISKGDILLGRKYLSTTYASLTVIFVSIIVVFFILNSFLNWSGILNLSPELNEEIRWSFYILGFFFCINFVANTVNVFLLACQMPALSSLLSTMGQVVSLLTIIILTKTVDGSLVYLAIAVAAVPCITLLVCTLIVFSTRKYGIYRPSLKLIDFSLVKDILNLGIKFFVVSISMLIIFQLINVILTRLQGPLAVTQYNIAYKYFNVLHMGIGIIITPFWSAFTEAYAKHDKEWMMKTLNTFDKIQLLICLGAGLMLIVSSPIYNIWVGEKVFIPFSVSMATCIYILSMSTSMVYMYMVNGIGKIGLQLLIYSIFAVIAYPVSHYACKLFGIPGILIIPSMVYFVLAILMRIQLSKLLNNTATGIWNK